MSLRKNKLSGQFKLHIIVIYVMLIFAVLLTAFVIIFRPTETDVTAPLVGLLSALVLLIAILIMLSMALRMLGTIAENGAKLEKIAEALEKSRAVLTQINHNTRLSETAKAIAFRDADRQSLRETVFDKLQQQDFSTAYKIIDEIARSSIYQELVEQLRADADRYRDATDAERVNQVIAQIEKLFEAYQWAKASAQIERLIKAAPKFENAKAMRQKLLDKKQDRKKILLTAWDDAVKRQLTDRSIGILRELDMYLTPNEGLALQEAAKGVFRNKLHNLGVQFSLAVAEKQWAKAFQIGQQIMRDYPNSRMAEEIREKGDILKQKVQPQDG